MKPGSQNPDRLLIVDDEPAIRLFLSEELRDAGYEVDAVAGGEEALAYLEQHSVDLILMDFRMQGMDGLQTMAEIRRRPMPPEIIMLTAHATLDTAIAAMRQGGHDFLIKPCSTADLLAGVRRGLQRHKEALDRDAMARLIARTASQLVEGEETAAHHSLLPPSDLGGILHGQDLLLDRNVKSVHQSGNELRLTPTEFDLLAAFLSQPDHPLDYVSLAQQVSSQRMLPHEARDAMGTHIWRLRRKLGQSPKGGPYIVNVRGRGYKFVS
jgi:DNA-binding response OmpR family regulator